jgi:hypothetical protein
VCKVLANLQYPYVWALSGRSFDNLKHDLNHTQWLGPIRGNIRAWDNAIRCSTINLHDGGKQSWNKQEALTCVKILYFILLINYDRKYLTLFRKLSCDCWSHFTMINLIRGLYSIITLQRSQRRRLQLHRQQSLPWRDCLVFS